ncbi:GONST4 [Symbiodinium natans]|uniref:GONST4 protein n=1 Tax=Symbiodinium natans TaxID=878477 RepID=A0A812IKL3_9DINO|nr:GONST4 [Symbiodinium natans]
MVEDMFFRNAGIASGLCFALRDISAMAERRWQRRTAQDHPIDLKVPAFNWKHWQSRASGLQGLSAYRRCCVSGNSQSFLTAQVGPFNETPSLMCALGRLSWDRLANLRLANVRLRQIKAIRWSHFPGGMLVSSLFTLCLTSSLVGLRRVHVPMVVVGKNLGPFCTAILESLLLEAWRGRQPMIEQRDEFLIFLDPGAGKYTVCHGRRELRHLVCDKFFRDSVAERLKWVLRDAALFAAAEDLEGVFLVGLNAALEKYVVRTVDQAALGFSLYRCVLAVPLLGIMLALGMEDVYDALLAIVNASNYCLLVLAVSTIFSAAAGLLVFTLQGRVSATTTQIASLCYKLATTALSLVLFPEAQRDLGLLAFIGYGLSTVSVALYAQFGKTNA